MEQLTPLLSTKRGLQPQPFAQRGRVWYGVGMPSPDGDISERPHGPRIASSPIPFARDCTVTRSGQTLQHKGYPYTPNSTCAQVRASDGFDQPTAPDTADAKHTGDVSRPWALQNCIQPPSVTLQPLVSGSSLHLPYPSASVHLLHRHTHHRGDARMRRVRRDEGVGEGAGGGGRTRRA